MLKNDKIIPVVVILLIIAMLGNIMLGIKGMNYGLQYGANTTIKISLESKPEMDEIIKEIFGKKYDIKFINNSENRILVTVKSASNEQIDMLINKINEKYSLSITTEDLEITNNPAVRGKDLVLPYITPALIVFVLILIYFAIRYKSIGILEILVDSIIVVLGVQLLYSGIHALIRIPVNELTMPISMLLFVLSFIALTEIYEKKYILIKNAQK